MSNPAKMTVGDLVETTRRLGAGSMMLSDSPDDPSKRTFLILVAVEEEAARLYPLIDQLTDDDPEAEA